MTRHAIYAAADAREPRERRSMAPRFQEEAVQSLDQILTDSFADVVGAAEDARVAARVYYYGSTDECARLFVSLGVALFLFNRVVVLVTQSLLYRRHRMRKVCADATRAAQNGSTHQHDD